MSITKAVDILQQRQRIEKTPLYLAILGDILIAAAILVAAWSITPNSIRTEISAPAVAVTGLILYQTAQASRTRRRAELAELRILELERVLKIRKEK